MKKLMLFPAICLAAMVGVCADLPTQPVFQLRAVLEAPSSNSEEMVLTNKNRIEKFEVQKDCLLDGSAIKSATATKLFTDPQSGKSQYAITVKLTQDGGEKMKEATTRHLNERLAIVIDGKLNSVPVIESPITSGTFEVTGSFSKAEAEAIVKKINSSSQQKN